MKLCKIVEQSKHTAGYLYPHSIEKFYGANDKYRIIGAINHSKIKNENGYRIVVPDRIENRKKYPKLSSMYPAVRRLLCVSIFVYIACRVKVFYFSSNSIKTLPIGLLIRKTAEIRVINKIGWTDFDANRTCMSGKKILVISV